MCYWRVERVHQSVKRKTGGGGGGGQIGCDGSHLSLSATKTITPFTIMILNYMRIVVDALPN